MFDVNCENSDTSMFSAGPGMFEQFNEVESVRKFAASALVDQNTLLRIAAIL